MREIEFRGKNCEDKWIYGQLTIIENDYYINYLDEVVGEFSDTRYIDYIGTEVSERTIGQYTGLKDNNGKKIFEGDIVEFETNVNCITNELKPYWKDCYEKEYKFGDGTWWVRKDQAIVQWNESKGEWELKVYNNKRYKRKSKLFTYRESGYVIVGNIYDNSELIGD